MPQREQKGLYYRQKQGLITYLSQEEMFTLFPRLMRINLAVCTHILHYYVTSYKALVLHENCGSMTNIVYFSF